MIEVLPSRIQGEVRVPGSKYVANRVLLIAALAQGTSCVSNLPENDDVFHVVEALRALGVSVELNDGTAIIRGADGKLAAGAHVEVENSGTLFRFITAIASLSQGEVVITGSKRISERPITPLLNALHTLGLRTDSLSSGSVPLKVIGGTLDGGNVTLRDSVSSQFVSALLLVAPYAKKAVSVSLEGASSSLVYIGLTIDAMAKFGVRVEKNRNGTRFDVLPGQRYKPQNLEIPSDWSSANYLFAGAALTGGSVTVRNLEKGQPESGFIDALSGMGCEVKREGDAITVAGSGNLNALSLDMSEMPDAVQTLAVLASFAKGTTRITGIANLRFKESDRIGDTITELQKLGIVAKYENGVLSIHGETPKGATIDSHGDHRMAMSFALAGLKIPGVRIQDQDCVGKSFPGFWKALESAGGKLR
ncbi:MAG: 3-phosphoshikimate 1-carboxyvinyltransferase [Nanoarchaeota archaeon]|nr:3-phosphoshikimate 1-carboxyvinyltransferase [Nanoarchaeota archaeon]